MFFFVVCLQFLCLLTGDTNVPEMHFLFEKDPRWKLSGAEASDVYVRTVRYPNLRTIVQQYVP